MATAKQASAMRGNLILYSLAGFDGEKKPQLKPLFSCNADDRLARSKMGAAIARQMMVSDCDHSALHCVREYREADESGTLKLVEYSFFDPATGNESAVSDSLKSLFEGAK